jgi:hypothetical protein
MSAPEPHCPGSLTYAEERAASGTALSLTAVCAVCGATLSLGYAGRIPIHQTPVEQSV